MIGCGSGKRVIGMMEKDIVAGDVIGVLTGTDALR
jgi:hypothetical protein